MIDEAVGGILKLVGYIVYHLFIEVICFYTGECILYIITFGKKKPKWDYYLDEKPSKFVIFSELSVWVGLCFWIFIIVLIVRAIL